MTSRYADVLADLRASYDGGAAKRDGRPKQWFKVEERHAFLDRLQAIDARRLLEIGAGTGEDSVFFADAGLDVVAVDLSPANVARCRAKGLTAYARDFLNLGFDPESFDAVYAMNCLLHVPNADLPEVLRAVRTVLKPGGLLFIGLWGNESSSEGPLEDDDLAPPRFVAFRSDAEIFRYATGVFDLVDFHTVYDDGRHFQALTLVRRLD
jgi:SAM-dependent methyltransferase